MARDARVVRRVLWIPMPEVILHGAQIGAPVGQVVTATVAQHVRPDPSKLRPLTGKPNDVVHGLAGELRLLLGDEQPGQIVFAGGEVPLDRAQLVAAAIGCSTESEFFRRATHIRERLTSTALRRFWMASLTRTPWR